MALVFPPSTPAPAPAPDQPSEAQSMLAELIFGRTGLVARMGLYPLLGVLAASSGAFVWDAEALVFSIHFTEGGLELVGYVTAYLGTVIWSRKAKAKGGVT